MCGLDQLSVEERAQKAKEILDSMEIKQSLCLQCPGLTHKDIERTMKSVLAERHITKPKTEEELYPEKYGQEPVEEWSPGGVHVTYSVLTREQTRALFEKSEKEVEEKPKPKQEHDTYSMEEVAALIQGDYHPDKFRYKKRKKK